MKSRDLMPLLLGCTIACTAPSEPTPRFDELVAAEPEDEPTPPDPAAPELVECDATGPVLGTGPVLTEMASALTVDQDARLLAAATYLHGVRVFETRCWTQVKAFLGRWPQFVKRELVYEAPNTYEIVRWDPDTDAVTPFFADSPSVIGGFGYAAREHELLVQDAPGSITHWQGPASTHVGQLGRRHLCGFGFLTETTAYAVSESGQQTIWELDGGAVLEQSKPRAYGCAVVAASSDGRLAVADRNGTVLISDAPNRLARRSFGLGRGRETVQSVIWDGPHIHVGGEKPRYTGVVWRWEPGDEQAEVVSRHSVAVGSLAVSRAWLAVGLYSNGYFYRRLDEPRPPSIVPASHVEIRPFPLLQRLNSTPFRPIH